MSALHLITGGDEDRRSALVADLVHREIASGGVPVVVGWGSALLPKGEALPVQGAAPHVPEAWSTITAAADALLDLLGLPSEVGADLLAGLRSPQLHALLATSALLDVTTDGCLVLVCPPETDAADVLLLPARAARAVGALVPVLARWEVLVAPRGVGALSRPAPEVLEALRTVEQLLVVLDARLASDAHIHHLPGAGLVESSRTTDLTIALALMGRRLDGTLHVEGTTAPPDDEVTGDPFVLAVPLPGLSAADITLEREDDDLVVTAGRHSRVTRLGALHRRCHVASAGMRAGVLTLDLEPDEAVWPRAGV